MMIIVPQDPMVQSTVCTNITKTVQLGGLTVQDLANTLEVNN